MATIRDFRPDDPQKPLTSRFAAGQLVGGRYRIVRPIARGGMGEVYEAEDEALHERVALKTIHAERAHPVAIERFKREIQLSRRVTHPNVGRVYDLGIHETEVEEPVTFLTMELLAGPTLADRLREEKHLRLPAALRILEQLTKGLDAIHLAGIVHRDLKCTNVMLVPDPSFPGGDRVVVTDFGLASMPEKGLTSLTPFGTVVGTADYMAPEQADGRTVTPAADIYSLGIVIYEMVTGTVPFVAATSLSALAMRLVEAPPRPSTRLTGLDPVWESAILRCLERQPEARFRTAGEVAEALRKGETRAPRVVTGIIEKIRELVRRPPD